jgi:hypothetical protein
MRRHWRRERTIRVADRVATSDSVTNRRQNG